MQDAALKCPFSHSVEERPVPSAPGDRTYIMNGGPKGLPVLGNLLDVVRNPLGVLARNAVTYGDIIPIDMPGMKSLQLNHPDLIRYVLMDNHKNYYKSAAYIRFQSAVGQGLITSNGEKWRRDRQKLQPLFKREQIEGYYFDIVNDVAEKYKRRWLALTEKGPAEVNITRDMASITMEVILRTLFGKDNLDDRTILLLHSSFDVVLEYLKKLRILPKVDLSRLFHTPANYRYRAALDHIYQQIKSMAEQYKRGELSDKFNMLALLLEAQKEDPDLFTDQNIQDQSISMIFGGFETTANTLQWLWYALDSRPDILQKLQSDITSHAPCTATQDSTGLTFNEVADMQYLDAVFKETLRLYPPFWVTSREPLEEDVIGGVRVKPGTVLVLPQIVVQRNPRWWDSPNSFMPERFSPENEAKIDLGLYFPFSLGPRKCIGYKFAEMEAKTVLAKLAPLFKVRALNVLGNDMDLGISVKLREPLRGEIHRI